GLSRRPQEWRTGPRIEIAVHRLASGLHLQFTPLPRAECYEARAGKMRGGFVDLIRSGGGVGLQDVAGLVAVESFDRVGESLGRRFSLAEHGARRLFLRVRSRQQRNLGLLARLV